jgi:RNA polymerase sigma factor (sigma-70 family)
MAASSRRYSRELRKVLGHVDRLSKLLVRWESHQQAGAWVVGRSGELRAVVSCTITDWRKGVVDESVALGAITSYVDGLHRAAAKRLRCGPALECCTTDDAITFDPDEQTALNFVSTLGAGHTEAATLRTGWVDETEMLDRFRSELGRVDKHARALLRRLGFRSVTLDDLCGFGREGLLDAARSYDERHAVPFSHWATIRIRRAMIDGVRRWGPLPRRVVQQLKELEAADGVQEGQDSRPRVPNGTAADPGLSVRQGAIATVMPLCKIQVASTAFGELPASPEEIVANAEQRAALQEIVARLPDRKRRIVEGYFAGETLKELGAITGTTESGASKILSRALVVIRRDLRRYEGIIIGPRTVDDS